MASRSAGSESERGDERDDVRLSLSSPESRNSGCLEMLDLVDVVHRTRGRALEQRLAAVSCCGQIIVLVRINPLTGPHRYVHSTKWAFETVRLLAVEAMGGAVEARLPLLVPHALLSSVSS